jgi:ribosome biogenesis protein ENP2
MDALSFAAGDSSGKVHLFDLRSSKPLFSKDHHYDTPITQIQYHSAGKVISSCEQAVRIWDSKTGAPFTAMEPFASAPSKHGSTVTNSLSIAKKKKRLFGSSEMYQGVTARSDQTADFSGRITDFCLADAAHGHGLVMVAGDCPHVQAYFVPDLGPAPRWVSFLEALAEDDAKGAGTEKNTLYADYKFVTREELDRLGLGHLIGTDLLRAYMHGFFMDMRLYRKARDVSDPFEYARWRDEQIAEKIRKERESRVKRDAEIAKEKAVAEIKDPRFMRMVEDADFAVDQESAEFKRVFTNKRRREEDYGSDEEDLNAKKQGSKSEGDEDSDAEAEEQVYDESILDKQIAAVEAEDDGSSEDEDKIRKVYLDPLAKKRKMRDERSAAKEEERKKLAAEAQAKEEEKKKMRRLTMDERLKIEEERRAKEVKEKERENKRRIFIRHGGDDRRRMDFGKKKR